MPVPANYHDDAAARYGLGPEAAEAMRAADMFIDADSEGRCFRHLYTRAFAKTFFFEFVERAPGYAGYGAPNAPIRLAVQNRFRASPEET